MHINVEVANVFKVVTSLHVDVVTLTALPEFHIKLVQYLVHWHIHSAILAKRRDDEIYSAPF